MVPSLLLSSVSIWNLDYSVQKFTVKLLENASTSLFSQLLMLEGKEMRTLYPVCCRDYKAFSNASYGCQLMNRSRHTITKYLNDEETRKAINEPLFKRLISVQNDLYESELLKSTIEHKEPIIAGSFILQYANLRMLEFNYNFFDSFCDVN